MQAYRRLHASSDDSWDAASDLDETLGRSRGASCGVSSLRDYLPTFVLALVVCLLCWGTNAFSDNVRIDVETFINKPGTLQGWMYIGRWGLYLIKLAIGTLMFNPYYEGALFVLFFSASAVAWVRLIEVIAHRRLRARWAFVFPYLVANWWSYNFYFLMQSAEIALCLLLIPAAINMVYRATSHEVSGGALERAALLMGATAMLVLANASYQANVPLEITGMSAALFVLACRLVEEGRPRQARRFLVRGVPFVGAFLLAYGAYSLITGTFFRNSVYLTQQIMWGVNGFDQCVRDIAAYVWGVLTLGESGSSGLFALGIVASLLVALLGMVMRSRAGGVRSAATARVFAAISYAMLVISPFILSIIMGVATLPRTQFSVPLAAAFLLAWSVDVALGLDRPRLRAVLGGVLSAGVVALCALSFSFVQRELYTDEVRFRQESEFAASLVRGLELTCHDQMTTAPTVLVGRYVAPLNAACVRDDVWGRADLEHDYMHNGDPAFNTERGLEFIEAATGTALVVPDEGQRARAVEASQGMPSFPAEGSIRVVDGLIVVRLSD